MTVSAKNNSKSEIKIKTDRDANKFGNSVSKNEQLANSIAGQTTISLPWTIGQDAEQKKQFVLLIDGLELPPSDFTFINIVNNFSSTILLDQPLSAGQSIVVKALGYYFDKFNTASQINAKLINDINEPHLALVSEEYSFIKKSFITAPNTTIVNRAKVLDDSNILKPLIGQEIIYCRSIKKLPKEFGANGESVYENQNKDSRIRFMGYVVGFSTTSGTGVLIDLNGEAEVTFYGTDLQVLTAYGLNNSRAFVSRVDGGSPSSNLWPLDGSDILTGRNYNTNAKITVASGLALGWHTVRLTVTGVNLYLYGFNVINNRTDLAITSGEAYYGAKQLLNNGLHTSAYNAGVAGVRGARVLKYLFNNTVSQAVTEVGAQGNLNSADHALEEIVRPQYWREFGQNRTDDFLTVAVGTIDYRSFTLEDGTTNLTSFNSRPQVYGSENGVLALDAGTSNFFTYQFVGCGLDVIARGNASNGDLEVSIDDVVLGNISHVVNNQKLFKIVSGLKYGSHIVKFRNLNAGQISMGIEHFLPYQPKKPIMPVGAMFIADYNVLGNFTANTTAGINTISQGVIRNFASRNNLYVGPVTWQLSGAIDPTTHTGGVELLTNSAGVGYIEINFFGIGFDWRQLRNGASATNATVQLDGVTMNVTNFPSLASNIYGTAEITFNTATGLWSNTSNAGTVSGVGWTVTGLPLGWHKLRITTVNSSDTLRLCAFDSISPIHAHDLSFKKLNNVNQNKTFSPVKEVQTKRPFLKYDGTNDGILSSFGISSILKQSTGIWLAFFEIPFKESNCIMTGSTSTQGWSLNGHISPHVRTKNMASMCITDTAGAVQNPSFFDVLFNDELEGEE